MSCSCQTLTAYSLSCDPSIGGISKIEISNDDTTFVEIQCLDESGSYTSALSYDRKHNLKAWTSTITFDTGNGFNEGNRELVEALPCPSPRTIKITCTSGHVVTFTDAYIKEANFSVQGGKLDAGSGTITMEAITLSAPTVTDPS